METTIPPTQEDEEYIGYPLTKEEAIRYHFFVCYECRDDQCGHCIGIPCMCPCPIPATEPEYYL